MVLGTDMKMHFEHLTKLKSKMAGLWDPSAPISIVRLASDVPCQYMETAIQGGGMQNAAFATIA